jgi:uncharacterized protein YjbJ (UPF0337 family)
MNQDQFEGKWKQLKGSFKEKWGKFTDDDITRFNGNRDQIVGALQEKYGQTKEQAQRDFDAWYNSAADTGDRARENMMNEKVRTGGGNY